MQDFLKYGFIFVKQLKLEYMPRKIKWTIIAGLTAILPALISCNKGDYDYSMSVPNATVTVKPLDGNKSFYLQLDEKTTLEPCNMSTSPFGDKEVRAFINFTDLNQEGNGYTKKVTVNWMKEILTKNMVNDLGNENDSKYGNDPIDLLDSWVTIVEDGYITLQFITPASATGIAHEVNLIYAGTEKDPYVVEFRHNAHGDYSSNLASGFAAFRLDGQDSELKLPDTHGKTVDLTFKYKSLTGPRSVKFKYCTRKTTETGKPETGNISQLISLR